MEINKRKESGLTTKHVAYSKPTRTYYISSLCIKTREEAKKKPSSSSNNAHPSVKVE